MSSSRIAQKFQRLSTENKAAFISYIMAGDPDLEQSLVLMKGLPAAGVDIIELGIPFTDPMADGATIQLAGQRALDGGQTLMRTLEMVERFREEDQDTPIVLMGYYNPIYAMGVPEFLEKARVSGVDGLIVVDLPPEEDLELCLPARDFGLDFIRLATPTTDENRLPQVLKNASGFVYYVSITGITGAASVSPAAVAPEVARIKDVAGLPVVVGFGVKTQEQAKAVAEVADGVVVGSAIVERVAKAENTKDILAFVSELAKAVHRE